MVHRLTELASLVNAELLGDGEHRVSRTDALERADADAVAFFIDPKRASALSDCSAGALILKPDQANAFSGNRLLVKDPYLAYAQIARLLHREPPVVGAVHPAATVSASARIDPSSSVSANAVIQDDAHIGACVQIGAGAVIDAGVHIGDDTIIGANAVVTGQSQIGKRCRISAGVVIGESGFGFARDGVTWIGIPQRGSVHVGDDVEIGANTTIDRGTIVDTVIEDGVKLDNQIQVGHNVRLGEHCIIAAATAIAGSVQVGARCLIGGHVAIRDHVSITDDVVIEGASVVLKSIDEAGRYSSSMTVQPATRWKRNGVLLRKLDELAARIRKLEH